MRVSRRDADFISLSQAIVAYQKPLGPMWVIKRRLRDVRYWSANIARAEVNRTVRHFAFGPQTDIFWVARPTLKWSQTSVLIRATVCIIQGA
jgi:hypothetical protein